MTRLSLPTMVGMLTICERDGAIVAIDWDAPTGSDETPLLVRARDQLAQYFAGTCRAFDLPLAPAGNAFQKAVWDAMLCIPYGATATYGDIAREIDSAARAVGSACGANPIPVIIPCHRVVGAGGRLTGYSGAGGLATKRTLLDLETGHAPLPFASPAAA